MAVCEFCGRRGSRGFVIVRGVGLRYGGDEQTICANGNACRKRQSRAETIVWEDPPTPDPHHTLVDVSDLLAELMERPGVWARVHVGGGTGTTKRAAMLRKAGCDVRLTRAPDGAGKRVLYARYHP